MRQLGEAGFTLIEILVAFAIAIIALAALYQLFGIGTQTVTAADRLEAAIVLARSALNAGAVVADGEQAQQIGPYQRRVLVQARPDLARSGAPAGLSEIEVEVSWHEGRRQRRISLSTLRVVASATAESGQ
ncbi:MAG TPA: prepilin-type N-terminal cleavage/methylation domain-containing protein [Stellaceae bacterium]|nr:prepilin-type N-terminal cleavage/methylation domain-containing protein [Stellaceae bacterium]